LDGEDGRITGYGYGEEEKDIIVRTGKTERMAEYGRGRVKGWQSMDG
jgi:hypothetical protein